MKKTISGILVLTLLSACSPFMTCLKLEHTIERAVEAVESVESEKE